MKDIKFSRNDYLELIGSFLKKDSPIIWQREIKIAKKLLSEYPSMSFWRGVKIDFKLNSLAWFFSPNGKKILDIEYQKYTPENEESDNNYTEHNNIENFNIPKELKQENLLINNEK
jgi:hypothetical protein